jgi:putative membrane protein
MKNLIYLPLVVVMLLFVHACKDKHGKNYNKTLVDDTGLSFIKNGIESGLTETKASGLVITNSSNQRVIRLAKLMLDDHTKAGDELTKIENDKRVIEKDTINADHQQMINDLSKKSGAAFDKAYLQMMVADHENAVKLFTAACQDQDSDIKKFAAKTLPTIQLHLDSARAILTSFK